jgi:NADPH-dependent glutamate synthase beta subunit-like oxidoreductase
MLRTTGARKISVMSQSTLGTVAVIGAGKNIDAGRLSMTDNKSGTCGVSMLKTLREDGFKVTCYERRQRVGGLWAYTDDPSMTSSASTHAA